MLYLVVIIHRAHERGQKDEEDEPILVLVEGPDLELTLGLVKGTY